jgi:hypothetical protein
MVSKRMDHRIMPMSSFLHRSSFNDFYTDAWLATRSSDSAVPISQTGYKYVLKYPLRSPNQCHSLATPQKTLVL